MGNPPTANRIFMVKAGMTPQDVINSKKATAQQKKMAYVFDSDGVAGYSQREADVFNATLITDRGQNGVSLWTRYKDGSKKETKYNGDIAAFKFAPKGDVKPYVLVKGKQTKSATTKQTNILAKATPLPPLTEVIGLDTVTFKSKADSIAYHRLGNQLYNEYQSVDTRLYNEYHKIDGTLYNTYQQTNAKLYNDYLAGKISEQQWIKGSDAAEQKWIKASDEAEQKWIKASDAAEQKWIKASDEELQRRASQIKKYQPKN